MDMTKQDTPNSLLVDAARIKSHDCALRLAVDICEAKLDQEKRRVDKECNCDGTGDYSAVHSLRSVIGNITVLMVNEK